MEKPLNIGNKPWICMEGIFDPKQSIKLKYEKSNIKIIFYAGTLTERYGILNLIKAFSLIESEDYRLMICGGGDIIGRILELAKIDTRIIYLGQLERTKVNEMLQKATVLVNPRTSDHEFCKYSFPSKTLEYLASGKPTIMYKLPGIPDEYFNYCYALDDKSPQKLAEMIINVCETDVNELRKLTEQAHNFILKFKNPDIQCRKIYDMLNHL
jgi:glycosyltransferase involved in cell wall biosynthesis